MTDAPPEIQFGVKINHSKFSINDAYEMRQQCQKEAEASLSKWTALDEDHKQVLDQIVRRAIESMHANTDRWLPHCMLDGTGGDKVDVRISILLSDIEAQVDMLVDATDFEVDAVRRRLIRQVTGEAPEIPDDEFLEYVDEAVRKRGMRLSVDETLRLMEMVPGA